LVQFSRLELCREAAHLSTKCRISLIKKENSIP
jgi:hypothetical protein